MKLRSREVNVFSMSALDLFASAMGAFMFLAIMALPFFPNTGDSPKISSEIKKRLKVAQSELKKNQKKNEGLQKDSEAKKKIVTKQQSEVDRLKKIVSQAPSDEKVKQQQQKISELKKKNKKLKKINSTPQKAFPSMDIVIALDTTGSLEHQVNGLKSEIIQLAELLMKLSPDAAMGIIDFKDRCEPQPIRSMNIVKLSKSSLGELQRFANRMRARSGYCNKDKEEALDMALEQSLRMSWRSGSKAKSIILISDNGAYFHKESEVLAKARAFHNKNKRNEVSTVFVDTSRTSIGARKEFLVKLAKEGGGNFIRNRSSFTATILLALAE